MAEALTHSSVRGSENPTRPFRAPCSIQPSYRKDQSQHKYMADLAGTRSQMRGNARRGSRSRNGKSFPGYDTHQGHCGYENAAQNGGFGREYAPQHVAYRTGADGMQELQMNGNSAHTPHSESSESDRIAALHMMATGTISQEADTANLQQLMVEAQSRLGFWSEVEASSLLKPPNAARRTVFAAVHMCLASLKQCKQNTLSVEWLGALHRLRLSWDRPGPRTGANCRGNTAHTVCRFCRDWAAYGLCWMSGPRSSA